MVRKLLSIAFAILPSFAMGQFPDYPTALAEATRSRKPLGIIVSACWCNPCKLQKSYVKDMPEAVVTVIDIDREPEIAKQLMDERVVPQVVLFYQTGKREEPWRRLRAVGLQTRDRVLEMVRKAKR